jgi:hypothetical protein
LPETIASRVYEYGEKWSLMLWKLGNRRLHILLGCSQLATPSHGHSEGNESLLAIVTYRDISSRHLLLRNKLQVPQVSEGNPPCPDILPIVFT